MHHACMGQRWIHKCHVCFGQPLRLVHCRMLQDPRWRLAEQVPRVFLLCLVFPCVPTAWFFIKFWLFYSVLQCSTAHSALWVQVAQVQAIAEEAKSHKSHKSHKLRKDSVAWTSWTGIRNISEYFGILFTSLRISPYSWARNTPVPRSAWLARCLGPLNH